MILPNCGRRGTGLLLAAFLALFATVGAAAPGTPSPWVATTVQLKAAFLHKFPAFVEWPPGTFVEAHEPFVIGVLGADDVYRELREIAAGRPVQGRGVVVRRVDKATAPLPHVLYIGPDVASSNTAALSAWLGTPVLTVTDEEVRFQGTILRFVERDGGVRFEASLPQAQRAGLRISARLLAVAVRVIEVEP
ncbi:YfiR family protein [Azohydromonas aeria]|uniref:YfiR family protein n=1 Tax=Azohydromonas aeria TaxID=2590212 RepID=UPI0012F8D65E|nr:YfiR family protein [Azohydromonas aeria]